MQAILLPFRHKGSYKKLETPNLALPLWPEDPPPPYEHVAKLPLDEASSVITAHKHAARSAAMTQI